MKALNRALTRLFKPTAPKRPDTHRKAREEAKRLAALHGIEIEAFKPKDGTGMNVWPPKGFKGKDPHEGDHYAEDWTDALERVKAYVPT